MTTCTSTLKNVWGRPLTRSAFRVAAVSGVSGGMLAAIILSTVVTAATAIVSGVGIGIGLFLLLALAAVLSIVGSDLGYKALLDKAHLQSAVNNTQP